MKSLVTILIIMILSSCNSDDRKEHFNLDVGIEFSITDSEGNDLLNPENSNSYNHSDIKLFYKKNGVYDEVFNKNLDHPRNIKIYKHIDNYRIRITLNHIIEETQPETLIKWNENDSDTIKAEFNRTNSSTIIKKTWLNDSLIWDSTSNSEPYFELNR